MSQGEVRMDSAAGSVSVRVRIHAELSSSVWFLGEQLLIPFITSLPLGRGLLRRRWSDLVFDLLVRVSVVAVQLQEGRQEWRIRPSRLPR